MLVTPACPMTWIPQPTQDGSFTFFSPAFNETFHSRQGARSEAFAKFALATDLPRLAQRPSLNLLDVCYGLGYNTAAALETIWQVNPQCQVVLYGLDNDLTVAAAAISPTLIANWSAPVQAALTALANAEPVGLSVPVTGEFQGQSQNKFQGQLLIGDARQTIQQLIRQNFQAQAIFFDPFSPRRCPQLWTVEFFAQVARCLARPGRLATYSRSAAVRSALGLVGLQIGTIPLAAPDPNHPHEWAQGTVASWTETFLTPLSPMELEHLQTRAGIALRDPDLSDGAAAILARQQREQALGDRESTSSWRRRWGLG